ncbi:MAG: hypothetical protein WBN09_14025 [Woeseiaceae bacterium]
MRESKQLSGYYWPVAEVSQAELRGAAMRPEAAGHYIRAIISAVDPIRPLTILDFFGQLSRAARFSMKNSHFLLCVAIFGGVVHAGTIEIEDTGVTFVAPDEFEPLSQEVIDIKWPNKNGPRFVVGNERATTTIAYDVKAQDISGADMDELRASLEQTFNRIIPGIQWKENSVIEHEGRNWVYLEMTSNAIDTDIYNIMMLGGVGQEMIIFNFNSTKEDFPKYEEELRQSLKSIRVP